MLRNVPWPASRRLLPPLSPLCTPGPYPFALPRHLVPWEGTFGMYDLRAGRQTSGRGWASEGARPGPRSEVSHFQGAPGMSSLCDGILQCAAKVETRYGIQVSSMLHAGGSQGEPWEVYDQEGNSLGQFDWVVVTSASLGHEYNGMRLFGDAPLLQAAAQSTMFSELHDAVRHVTGTYSASPRHVAMMAWPTSQEVVETLRSFERYGVSETLTAGGADSWFSGAPGLCQSPQKADLSKRLLSWRILGHS